MDNLLTKFFLLFLISLFFFMKEIFCFSSSILGIILIYGEILKFKVYSSKLAILVYMYVMLIT